MRANQRTRGVVEQHGSKVSFSGGIGLPLLRYATSAISRVVDSGCRGVTLDFSETTGALQSAMLMISAYICDLRRQGLAIVVLPPKIDRIASLFRRKGWTHLLECGEALPHPVGEGLPAMVFCDSAQQQGCVTRMLNSLLLTHEGLNRGDLAAISWTIGEVTGNVLDHADSPIGGVVQMCRYRDRTEICVADVGATIPRTLRPSHREIGSDQSAVEHAIREGVTRDPNLGQGNGLFGTFQLAMSSDTGYMTIDSGRAHLLARPSGIQLDGDGEHLPGTVVVASLGIATPGTLEKALKFGGKTHSINYDFIEQFYEHESLDLFLFSVAEECASLFSRDGARALRQKIQTLAVACPSYAFVLDFSDAPMFSSSFADELIAKLGVRFGLAFLRARIRIDGMSSSGTQILSRVVSQRLEKPDRQL